MKQLGEKKGTKMEPESIHRNFEAAFNAGDLDGLLELYEPDAVLIVQPGSVVSGQEGIAGALQAFLDLQGQITLDTKLTARTGDLAYLTNRWTLAGFGPGWQRVRNGLPDGRGRS